MEIFDIDEVERIALLKMPTLGVETLEYLFKNYNEGAFKTEAIDLGEPVGNELW